MTDLTTAVLLIAILCIGWYWVGREERKEPAAKPQDACPWPMPCACEEECKMRTTEGRHDD